MEFKGKQVKLIEAGDATSGCITNDNHVYMWGSGLNGRLGNGSTQNALIPFHSQELKSKIVINLVMGTNTSFAILENRKVLAWGSSKSGKLGFPLSNGKNYELPKEIVSLNEA
jgi:alpha-tubulin suppressor-like RCC1 family protein